MKRAKDFRDLSIEELGASLTDARQQLFQLKNEREHSKKMEKPHQVSHLKKEIARMMTVMNENHLSNESV